MMAAVEQLNESFGEVATPQVRLLPPVPASAPAKGAPAYRAVRSDVAFIETKLARRIRLPERPLTADEAGLSAFVRTALEYGEATQTWDWAELPVGAPVARHLVDHFAGGVVRSLWLSREEGERFVLFGVVVPLGPTHILLPQARLINEQEVRVRLARPAGEHETLRLCFTADRIAAVIFRYEDWLPGGKRQAPPAAPERVTRVEDQRHIVREFPGNWRIRVSEDRRGLSDLLSNAVVVALEQLDRADRERVLRALPIVWGWQTASAEDWTAEPLPGADDLYLLKLTADLGLIVQGVIGSGMSVVEIVRPDVLRDYARDR